MLVLREESDGGGKNSRLYMRNVKKIQVQINRNLPD
jgi:hypothetical protein